jgi:hypothetical protein
LEPLDVSDREGLAKMKTTAVRRGVGVSYEAAVAWFLLRLKDLLA